MKTYSSLGFLTAMSMLIVACSNQADKPKSKAGRVIVIGVDGMSPDGISNSPTPVIDSIMEQGSYTMTARAVLPTSSSPNWKSMISGSDTEQHGVTSNKWKQDKFILPATATGIEDIYPTIFGVLREQRPGATIAAIYDWKGFGRLLEQSALDYDSYRATGREELDEDETVQLAIDYIKKEKPDFLFIHMDHVDHAGHEHGHGSSHYNESVTKADRLIGEIFQASKDAGTFDDTIFIVSADHGGVGTKHGGETLDEIEIPFMILGPGVKKNFQIDQQVMTYDNAATVAYILGVDPPYDWIGRPVKSVFK